MTRIVNNSLLHQNDTVDTYKVIRNWNTTFMTTDGPNATSMKIGLDDLGIPFDSHYRSRIVLPGDTQGFFLNYGTLKNVTFLLIKVTYNGNYDNPNEDDFDVFYHHEEETYSISYYFEGNSGITYPIGKLLLLNGSLTTPLTKIYLNNTLGFDVVLDVLHANIEPPKTIPVSSAITITNLYYNDITTNQVLCSSNTGYTGSTAFIVSGNTGYLVIPYSAITYIEKDLPRCSIYIYTTYNTITLKFLTEFDCNQAYSRMLFALTVDTCRYLTEDGAFDNNNTTTCGPNGTDITPPVIQYNGSVYWTGSGLTIPSNIILPLTGLTIEDLKILFISGVTDCWDGNISLSAVTLELYNDCYRVTGITTDGYYNIIITVTDNSGNVTINNITNILVDISPPVIVYQYGVLSSYLTGYTDTYQMSTTDITPGIYISKGFIFNIKGFYNGFMNEMDIKDNVVDSVYDLIDVDINKYMLSVLIVDEIFIYTEVSILKEYCVKLSISDRSGNHTEEYLIMKVVSESDSSFSVGYWKDEKVWIDTSYWHD